MLPGGVALAVVALASGCSTGPPSTAATPILSAAGAIEPAPRAPVVIYLVRHAEKRADASADPELSERGRERARALGALLGGAGVTHLLSTDTRRTKETLSPLAEACGVSIETLSTGATEAWLERLRRLPAGAVAVVAGHSNTIPALARGLAPRAPGLPEGDLDEGAYDRLFVIVSGAPPVALALRLPPFDPPFD